VVILGLIMALGYVTMGDSATAVAMRQWFMGIFRASFEPILNGLGRFARRGLTQQIANAVWRVTIGLVIALVIRYYFNGSRWPLYRRFVRIRMYRNKVTRTMTAPFRWAMTARPDIPRWKRACIGLVAGGLVFLLCLYVSHIYSETWSGWFGSMAFALVMFYLIEKLPFLGFDALLTVIAEKWRWLKGHPRIANIVRGKHMDNAVHTIVEKVSKRAAH